MQQDNEDARSRGSDESDDDEQSKDAPSRKSKSMRSSRACITCRRMKTRCEVDEDLGSQACKLCIRTRRQCIMQDIPRRRKRKTTERVADLEQKINALTTLLAAKEADASNAENDSALQHSLDQESPTKAEESLIDQALSQGLLDWQQACQAFDRYKNDMCQYFPFVVFSTSTDAATLKDHQPLLFFCTVIAGLGSTSATPRTQLCCMLTEDLAARVMGRGERSLELIQALLVHVTFYTKSPQVRELNFNQMIHVACTMALDIGLGRRPHKANMAQRTELYQLESLAARRAWLGCYYMATSITMSLRQPSFLRWSVYTEECLDHLSINPPALPSDVWLCDVIRLQRIAEAASLGFSMDDPGAVITLRDVRIQYQLRGYRQQLDWWREHAKTDLNLGYARHLAASTDLFVNEIALHPAHEIDSLRSPPRGPTLHNPVNEDASLSYQDTHGIPAREEALVACLAAIHECFDALRSMDTKSVCALPNLFFVRTGYAARALLKLLNICDQAESEGHSHIDVKDLNFESSLNAMISIMSNVQVRSSIHVAQAFGAVLTQIRNQGLNSSRLLAANKDTDGRPTAPQLDGDSNGFPVEHCSTLFSRDFMVREPVVSQPKDGNPDSFGEYHADYQPTQHLVTSAPSNLQHNALQWLPNNFEDAYMSGSMDVIQWFEQDFALDTGLFQTDDQDSLPGAAQWHH